jgi:hypothetical protein
MWQGTWTSELLAASTLSRSAGGEKNTSLHPFASFDSTLFYFIECEIYVRMEAVAFVQAHVVPLEGLNLIQWVENCLPDKNIELFSSSCGNLKTPYRKSNQFISFSR